MSVYAVTVRFEAESFEAAGDVLVAMANAARWNDPNSGGALDAPRRVESVHLAEVGK